MEDFDILTQDDLDAIEVFNPLGLFRVPPVTEAEELLLDAEEEA